jgi:hypothetical protein
VAHNDGMVMVMAYKVEYQLESFTRMQVDREKNKDDVISLLMYYLAQHEPIVLRVIFPDGSILDNGQPT